MLGLMFFGPMQCDKGVLHKHETGDDRILYHVWVGSKESKQFILALNKADDRKGRDDG